MRVVYNGPFAAVEIASIGLYAYRGEPLEVPDEVGQRLILQGPWSDPDAPDTPPVVTPPVPPPAEPEAPADGYDRLNLGQLRAVLIDRKLPVTGDRKALIKRLRDADNAPADPSAAADLADVEQTEESR